MSDTLDHTETREKPEKVREPTLWVTDTELIKRSGVPEKKARAALRAMDANPRSGFPKKNPLWGGRRFWPEVVEYWRKMPPQERRSA